MKLWEEFVKEQEKEFGAETVEKWIKPLQVTHFDAGNLYLEAKDSFHLNWVEEHLRPRMRKKLLSGSGRPLKVHVSAGETPSVKVEKKEWKPVLDIRSDALDPKATLNLFIPSQKDSLNFELFKELLQKKEFNNPLYLFGPPSVGKSHLLMAATYFLQQQGVQCLYVRAGTFTEHLIAAIRTGNMQRFRATYRKVDALLIDDIQVIGGRTATQEELFHTFNALQAAKKMMIFSATKAPHLLSEVEPRLTSRFEWGIVLPFHSLSSLEQKQLLEIHKETLHFPLTPEVSEYLLSHFHSSTQALLRALNMLILRSHQENRDSLSLNLATTQRIVSKLLLEEQKKELTSHDIIKTVSDFYGIKKEDILGKAQTKECVLPRQISMYLCRSLLKSPYLDIGKVFGRDHSTVMTSIKNIQTRLNSADKEIEESVRSLLAKLNTVKS